MFRYHSHLHAQYCDGLRGPFIVYDPEDPHKVRSLMPSHTLSLLILVGLV